MSEDPTRPIRPGEYGSPGGYGSSPDHGSPGGYGSQRDYGTVPEPGRAPEYGAAQGDYGQDPGYRPDGGRGAGGGYGTGRGGDRGYGAEDRGYPPQHPGRDGYAASSGTTRMPDAGYQGETPRRGRPRRRHRGLTITAIVVVVLLILLVVADRVAAGIAENEVATQIKDQGFPVKPKVTIAGFPFLTQLAARDFNLMTITAANVPEGPLNIASVNATMHGVHINSGFSGATVDQINGTALVTFAGLSHAAGISDGITLSDGGNGEVKATVDLGFISGSALAHVARTGPRQISVRVDQAGPIPLSALGPLQDFTVSMPSLPAGMTIQSVSVTGQGLLVSIAGTHTSFSQ